MEKSGLVNQSEYTNLRQVLLHYPSLRRFHCPYGTLNGTLGRLRPLMDKGLLSLGRYPLKTQYLYIAQEASDQERKRQWLAACKLWQEAIALCSAGSVDHAWAIARLEFCCHREGIKTLAY